MVPHDFVMTIDSDDEEPLVNQKPTKRAKGLDGDEAQLNPDLHFDLSGDPYFDLLQEDKSYEDLVKKGSKPEPISVDDIIARRRLGRTNGKRKREEESEEEDSGGEGEDSEVDGGSEGEEDSEGEGFAVVSQEGDDEDPLATSGEEDQGGDLDEDEDDEHSEAGGSEADEGRSSSDEGSDDEDTQAQKARKDAFFAVVDGSVEQHTSFLTMNLSRPVLKSLSTLGFHTPTPIQAATIPVGLLGKDIVGNAVTGSGKTAAFIIPMIERLLYRDRGKRSAATRCLILVPTRELAIQCYEVGKKLATHTDIQLCLIVGGLSVKAQESALRARPDALIATPGRLIDHLRNSPSFALDALDILVLDEADRMLEDGFHDELTEIIKSCPTSRQTMLFSATMTDSVDELVKLSLNKPVRLFVDPKRSTARGLIQEFVRVRANRESERSALLVALCKRTFKSGVLIFFRSKKLAHQIRVVFGLLGMSAEELHGDLSQEQRLRALQLFRDGSVDFLMATDLASRGLDIKGIDTVINYDMPGQLAQYLHRVGRTARAGKKGRSVSLVGEADRKMLKAAIKHAAAEDQVRHRTVGQDVVARWATKLESLKDDIAGVLQDEKEEKQLRQAEMELKKGQNMIEHGDEIYSRPARTWFQTGKDKQKAEAASKEQYESGFRDTSATKAKDSAPETAKPKRDKFSGLTRRVKRRKMALEEDAKTEDRGAVEAAIRSVKKASRPNKIGVPEPRVKRTKSKDKRSKPKATPKSGAFDRDLGQKTSRGEGVRAKKGDAIGRGKKAGSGKRKAR